MSRLEELIEQYCPDGVEFDDLNRIADIIRGKRITKAELDENGEFPVISGGVAPLGYYNNYNRDKNTITIAQYGTAGYIDFQKIKFWANDVCYSVLPKKSMSNRFLFHFLMSKQNEIYDLKTNAIPAHLPQNKLGKVRVPLIPLKIQDEIVRILDTFEEYDLLLNKELLARQKQYEFYRNSLLNFEDLDNHLLKGMLQQYCSDGVKYQKMEDIALFKYGFTEKAIEAGEYRYIRITDISNSGKLIESDQMFIDSSNELKDYKLVKNDILMARTGATFGKTMLFDSEFKSVYASFLIRIRFNNTLIPLFYWHFTQSHNYWNQANQLVSKAGQPQFNANALKSIIVPVPPIEIQEEIVRILVHFDSLVNDIKIGLPAEIEARQKQFEYYRNKLLTFKEVNS